MGILSLLIFMVMRMGFHGKGTYDRGRNLTYSDRPEMKTKAALPTIPLKLPPLSEREKQRLPLRQQNRKSL